MIKKIKRLLGIGARPPVVAAQTMKIDKNFLKVVPKQQKIRMTPKKAKNNPKINTKNKYNYFTAKNKRYFKTLKGCNGIPITAKEAVHLIMLRKAGMQYKDIIDIMEFNRKVSYRTLNNWIRKYNLGLMDTALFWICKNNIEGVDADIKEILHSYVGDL